MVSATGKEKSRNSANCLRIEKGLKKKAFELSTLVGIDVCMIILDPKQHGQCTDHCHVEPEAYPENSQEVHRIIQRYREYITTTTRDEQRGGVSTTGGVGGSKKKRKNGNLIQNQPAEILVTSSSSEHDDGLLKGEGSLLQNFDTEEELKNEFMEELRNGFMEELKKELMGFDQQNVNISNQTGEEENLLDSSLTAAASSSSEFLVEGDIWPSDELNEILNGFGDNADHNHHHEDSMFDLLPPLSPPPRPLPLTNAFINNILDSTSDNWPTTTLVEWDQLFI